MICNLAVGSEFNQFGKMSARLHENHLAAIGFEVNRGFREQRIASRFHA